MQKHDDGGEGIVRKTKNEAFWFVTEGPGRGVARLRTYYTYIALHRCASLKTCEAMGVGLSLLVQPNQCAVRQLVEREERERELRRVYYYYCVWVEGDHSIGLTACVFLSLLVDRVGALVESLLLLVARFGGVCVYVCMCMCICMYAVLRMQAV